MNKYQFWLKQGNTAIQLPLNPERIAMQNGSKNETFDVDGLGDVTILNPPDLYAFSFDGQFPAAYFPGCAYENLPDPRELYSKIDTMKKSGSCRFIITNTPINMEVTIENFPQEEAGGDVGTVYYSIELREYRRKEARQITVRDGKATLSNDAKRQDNRKTPATYTVKTGDNLWKIAKAQLGSGEKWEQLAKLNGIKPKYVLSVGQILKLA